MRALPKLIAISLFALPSLALANEANPTLVTPLQAGEYVTQSGHTLIYTKLANGSYTLSYPGNARRIPVVLATLPCKRPYLIRVGVVNDGKPPASADQSLLYLDFIAPDADGRSYTSLQLKKKSNGQRLTDDTLVLPIDPMPDAPALVTALNTAAQGCSYLANYTLGGPLEYIALRQ